MDTVVSPGQLMSNNCIEETYPYRHVPSLGQPPQPTCHIQCIQHSYTQSQSCLCQPTSVTQGRGTHKEGPYKSAGILIGTEHTQNQKQPQIKHHSGPQQQQ